MGIIPETVVVVYAITVIMLLDAFALSCGINGTGLAIAIAAIAGLGGFEMSKIIKKIKRE